MERPCQQPRAVRWPLSPRRRRPGCRRRRSYVALAAAATINATVSSPFVLPLSRSFVLPVSGALVLPVSRAVVLAVPGAAAATLWAAIPIALRRTLLLLLDHPLK